MICVGCECECEYVEAPAGRFSNCCDTDAVKGKVWLDRCTIHRARKDHFSPYSGKLIVAAGQLYRAHVVKGYYVLGTDRVGISQYTKSPINSQKGPAQ